LKRTGASGNGIPIGIACTKSNEKEGKMTETQNETQLVPYSLETATVEALKAKYMDVTILPDDKSAYAMVMSGLRECREIRLAVDAWHKDKKAWIVKAGKHYDGERRRVHGLIEPVENHLKDVRQVEDDRKDQIRLEAERIERERVEGIRAKIEGIRRFANIKPTMTAAQITGLMDNLADLVLSEKMFMEFIAEAEKAKEETWETLSDLEKARSEWEVEQVAAKAEAERLEKVRQAQEAERKCLEAIQKEAEEKARKEREAMEAERRQIEAEKKALEDAKRAEKERQERAEFERRAQEEAKARAEAEAKEKAERDTREAAEKTEKERIEKIRQEALRPDKEKLTLYLDSLLEIPEPELGNEANSILMWFSAELVELVDKAKEEVREL